MKDLIAQSAYIGVFISLTAYFIADALKRKFRLQVFNPLLIAVILTIAFLLATGTPYEDYKAKASCLSFLLTPATVCLAIPLYEQLQALKNNYKAILAAVTAGVISSMGSVLALAVLFKLDHTSYVTFLPKSVTSAIAMGISQEMGGYAAITVAVVIITGIIGNILAETICRAFKITDPVAMGIAIGSSSHAIGTTKAMELGPVIGAMSSLSIAISGVLTVFAAMVFQNIL